jgi:hypothetical protein
MLDLSTHADLLGVGTAFPTARTVRPELAIDGVQLTASPADLRVFALPQVQWEPVRTHPADLRLNFPQPLTSSDDGSPLVLGVQPAPDTVRLVPVAPRPLVRELVAAAARPETTFAVRFTLPFGIKAVASVLADLPPSDRPTLDVNEPDFGPLGGSLQISLTSATPAGLPGGAVPTAPVAGGVQDCQIHEGRRGMGDGPWGMGDSLPMAFMLTTLSRVSLKFLSRSNPVVAGHGSL